MSSPRAGPKDASVFRPEGGATPDVVSSASHTHLDANGGQFKIVSLKRRADFLRLRRSPAAGTATFVLAGDARSPEQACGNNSASASADDEKVVRVGYTVSKKIGSAVRRNRVKRRLRAAVAAVGPDAARPRHDYVLIAKPASLEPPFEALVDDLARAFARLHARLDAGQVAGGHRNKRRQGVGKAHQRAGTSTGNGRETDRAARGAGTAPSATDPH